MKQLETFPERQGKLGLDGAIRFCVLENKFKNIPSKRQNDHCEWIFLLVWFPESWSYMFKSMGSNSDKTHNVNINTSSKDSVSLSFFRLDKNYGPREYDSSNKVFPNISRSNQMIMYVSNT